MHTRDPPQWVVSRRKLYYTHSMIRVSFSACCARVVKHQQQSSSRADTLKNHYTSYIRFLMYWLSRFYQHNHYPVSYSHTRSIVWTYWIHPVSRTAAHSRARANSAVAHYTLYSHLGQPTSHSFIHSLNQSINQLHDFPHKGENIPICRYIIYLAIITTSSATLVA